jgi:hypothetical protein
LYRCLGHPAHQRLRGAALSRGDCPWMAAATGVCAAALRSPPVHHVLLRYHRRAQVHRARRRRYAPAASQGASPAGRPAPGDVFFYFTTCGWMMWNWLASRGWPAVPRCCSTTARPSPPRATGCSMQSMAKASTCSVPAPSTSRRSRKAASSRRAATDLDACARSCRPARRSRTRASSTCTATSRPTSACQYLRRHGHPVLLRRRLPRAAGALRRDPGCGPGYGRGDLERRRAPRCVAKRASWCVRGRSRPARSVSGTTRTARAFAPPTSTAGRASGPMATTASSRRTTASLSTGDPTRC